MEAGSTLPTIGLGPLTGALALALNITGILAKVYSELWDSVDASRYAQVSSLGGGRLATFLYGIRPLAARNVLSFTLMRADKADRYGNLHFRGTQGNFGRDMATASKCTVVEVREIVDDLLPRVDIHVPGAFVQRVIQLPDARLA